VNPLRRLRRRWPKLAELTNPEKSLTATIRSPFPREGDRTFRYAPLSSGLEIVRKSLGSHEIATVQTTTLDAETGLIRLTTTLAHSSGEWISSDWPVCPVSETATPHRMGAALTYARRYALFTLVGIAGEDDLDAQNLATPHPHGSGARLSGQATNGSGGSRGVNSPGRPNANGPLGQSRPILAAAESNELRDQLVTELAGVGSAEQAADWAQRTLPVKNTLTAGDAQLIEQAFRSKMAALESVAGGEAAPPPTAVNAGPPEESGAPLGRRKKRVQSTLSEPASIDKSALSIPEPRRVRDKAHVRFVSQQPCLVCGRRPADAHHLRFAQSPALGRKVSDEFTVPLCRVHHRELHRCGDEAEWWNRSGIDPLAIASAMWAQSHAPRAGIESVKLREAALERASPDDLTQPFVTNSGRVAAPRQPKGSSNRKTNPIAAAGSR
jgi:ERF superfamily